MKVNKFTILVFLPLTVILFLLLIVLINISDKVDESQGITTEDTETIAESSPAIEETGQAGSPLAYSMRNKKGCSISKILDQGEFSSLYDTDKYLLVSCSVNRASLELQEGEDLVGLYRVGCMFSGVQRYYLWNKSTRVFSEILSTEDMKKNFVPIDSEEKAEEYVKMATGSYSVDIHQLDDDYYLYVPKEQIVPTKVKKVDQGYQINLFDKQYCGCGYHPVSQVVYQVSNTGDIKEVSRTLLYENRADMVCVD